MYFSKLTLDLGRLSLRDQLYLVRRGEYAIHQWLWELFLGEERRNFLFRGDAVRGQYTFYVLSSQEPKKTNLFSMNTRLFTPYFYEKQKLIFSLRANPTVCRKGQRHDIFMDRKRSVFEKGGATSVYELRQQAAEQWLSEQGSLGGFRIVQSTFDAYREHLLLGRSGNKIQFRSVDFSGVLEVTEPDIFLKKMEQGYGKCRAFGCGLMLVKRLG